MQHGTTRWKTTPEASAGSAAWVEADTRDTGPKQTLKVRRYYRSRCVSMLSRLRITRSNFEPAEVSKPPTSHWKSHQRTESAKFLQIEWCLLHSINLPQFSLAYSACVFLRSALLFLAFNFSFLNACTFIFGLKQWRCIINLRGLALYLTKYLTSCFSPSHKQSINLNLLLIIEHTLIYFL